jgi:enterochelin esterase-like enzyme
MFSYESKQLNKFKTAYIHAESKKTREICWSSIKTPLIEAIPDDTDHHLVTFLYRLEGDDAATQQTSIYLYSTITGLPCSDDSQLIQIPKTDVWCLSLVLPSTLRTTYNFLIVDNRVNTVIKNAATVGVGVYPMLTGEFKKRNDFLMHLFEQEKVMLDQNNDRKIIYYIDFENLDNYFAKESILELPMAPKQPLIPQSTLLVKSEREEMKKSQRFSEHRVKFSDTCLKNADDYKQYTRKYWVYLPPDYRESLNQNYPMIVFLDVSEYIDTIPTPSILDRMIKAGKIPPCIAIFLEYSSDKRMIEYNCSENFTQFLANDFINILRSQNELQISYEPKFNTIVGLSAGGLAAFYAGLTHPAVFGNVIAQSPSFEMKKQREFEEMIEHCLPENNNTLFSIEAGTFETTPIELIFSDGTTQALSSFQANKNTVDNMNATGFKVIFHEFVGGHNTICWQGSLSDRLEEIYDIRLQEQNIDKDQDKVMPGNQRMVG